MHFHESLDSKPINVSINQLRCLKNNIKHAFVSSRINTIMPGFIIKLNLKMDFILKRKINSENFSLTKFS